jgi:hypothetical protein
MLRQLSPVAAANDASVISRKVSNFAQIGRGDSAKLFHGKN